MVVVSFFRDEPILREKLLDFMAETFKEVTSLFYCINPCAHDSIDGLPLHHHSGKNHIQEKMEDLVFHIGPTSFFQANTSQAYVLYRVVRDFAALTGKERVYDLYTGAGTIALFLSSRCKEVIGIDLSQAAIEDAVRNRELNGIQNAAFYAGDMKEVFTPEWVEQQGRPDVLILNPSRSGLERKVVKTIAALLPEKVIYVSCNPATQVRDLEKLIVEREAPYTIAHIQPVDMFPHTAHVENVVGLVRK